jgi:hypothetical protein
VLSWEGARGAQAARRTINDKNIEGRDFVFNIVLFHAYTRDHIFRCMGNEVKYTKVPGARVLSAVL